MKGAFDGPGRSRSASSWQVSLRAGGGDAASGTGLSLVHVVVVCVISFSELRRILVISRGSGCATLAQAPCNKVLRGRKNQAQIHFLAAKEESF